MEFLILAGFVARKVAEAQSLENAVGFACLVPQAIDTV